MQKFLAVCLIGIGINSYTPALATHWKVFWYMDSSDALSDMAIKNITDAMRGKPNDTVDFLIQMHAYGSAGLRYRVTDKGLIFIEEVLLTGQSKQDSIAAVTWAFTDNNAEHNLFIIANHGYGILDPHWDEINKEWKTGGDTLNISCIIKRSGDRDYEQEHLNHRGFLFNMQSHTYLNNNDLVALLDYMSTQLLHKKLDVIAFDTCMGDMLEVAYQVGPYADYLVGSQSCSLLDGFDYQNVVPLLNQGLAPRELVSRMVCAFDNYYARYDSSGVYTHAALDLSQVYDLTRSLNAVVIQLLKNSDYVPLIMNACKESPRFCMWPMYTDAVAFFKNIENQLDSVGDCTAIRAALHDFYAKANNVVVARCGGSTTKGRAHGFAIYLPLGIIDGSYYKTIFAQETQWINLLTVSCDQFKKTDHSESISN